MPELIQYDSSSDEKSDEESDKELEEESNEESVVTQHDGKCSKWMRNHSKTICEFANHLMSDQSSEEEFECAAGANPEGATAKSESEPDPKKPTML